jgi:hypothetical protein
MSDVDFVPVITPSVGHGFPRDSPAAKLWEIGTTVAEIANVIATNALNARAFMCFIYFSLFEGFVVNRFDYHSVSGMANNSAILRTSARMSFQATTV